MTAVALHQIIKMLRKLLLALTLLLATGIAGTGFLQAGTIRGQITDAGNGETLIGVNILISGTTTGTVTDLDGYYTISGLEAGTYSLDISYISYTPQTITDITLGADETKVIDVQLTELTTELAAVIIEARKVDNNVAALLTLQKRSINVQDGISAHEIARFGSTDAGESMKKITGASIVDGKYVYVRGLGDRYSNTQLNGQNLPSSDPYRNSTQLDIIPATMLDNIITSKTFSPDQPGSFTGGNVNITTKSFPDKFTLSLTLNGGFNDQSSFNNQFLGQVGGNLDWLGFDDGTRALPTILSDTATRKNFVQSFYIPSRTNDSLAAILDAGSKGLSTNMAPIEKTSPINHGFNFSMGNEVTLAGRPLGFNVGINYSRNYTLYTDGVSAQWQLIQFDGPGLNNNFNLTDINGVENPQIGAIVNLAYKVTPNNEIGFNMLYNHDAAIGSRYQFGKYPSIISNSDAIFETRTMSFRERSLASYQLSGKHVFLSANELRVEWAASMVNTSQLEPDLRFFANSYVGDNYFINPSEYPQPFHFWRNLYDDQAQAKVDIFIPFMAEKDKANKIKIGGSFSSKDRNFTEDRFQIRERPDATSYMGDPDAYFGPGNTGIIGFDEMMGWNITGTYVIDATVDANSYSGNETIIAGYGMIIYQLTDKWKFVGGARVETTDISVSSADTTKDEGQINVADVLPSVNLIYALNENMNLRGSFSQTIARPNLRELAPFFSFEFIGGETYLGNPNLERTNITNYDVRWEWFPEPGELIAVSAYYKNFVNPIIKVFNPTAVNPEIQFKNVDEAIVYGVELEARKNLSFISSRLSNFNVGTNLSFIQSRVALDSLELTVNQSLNPNFNTTRPFQGQSPYLINANVNYTNTDLGLDITAAFNVFGARLSEVSQAGTPDIYEQPAPTLDLFVKKEFAERLSVRLGGRNLLNARYRKTIEYKDVVYDVFNYTIGRTYTVSLSYNIQ